MSAAVELDESEYPTKSRDPTSLCAGRPRIPRASQISAERHRDRRLVLAERRLDSCTEAR